MSVLFKNALKHMESECGLRGQNFINPYRELSFGFKIWCRGKSSGIRKCDLNPDSDGIAVQFLLNSVNLDLCLLICKMNRFNMMYSKTPFPTHFL